jgi:hypothetical protein
MNMDKPAAYRMTSNADNPTDTFLLRDFRPLRQPPSLKVLRIFSRNQAESCLLSASAGFCLVYSSTLKKEAICPSEKLIYFHRNTQRYIALDETLQRHLIMATTDFIGRMFSSRWKYSGQSGREPLMRVLVIHLLEVC